MVYLNFPPTLTEEEETLRQKYAKLRKKKKQLQALRTVKPEREQPVAAPLKRPANESAENAKEQAKKLLKSGSIKIKADSQDKQRFKRSKNLERKLKDPAEKLTSSSVGFQPFSASHPEEEEKDSKKPWMRPLHDSFVSGGYERERQEERKEDKREMIHRDKEAPKRGNTIYVHGYGITEEILRKAFTDVGNILHVNMEKEKNVGFVTFEKMESADIAVNEVNGALLDGIKLSVSIARRQPTFEANDQSTASWSSIAASSSQKGSHKDRREMVTYDEEDIF